jgi:hypothetical protein
MPPSRLYRPSNGTEGIGFMAEWCDECARDDEYQTAEAEGRSGPDGCPILARVLLHNVGEPGYPTDWIYSDLGPPWYGRPRCTAFIPIGEPIPAAVLPGQTGFKFD